MDYSSASQKAQGRARKEKAHVGIFISKQTLDIILRYKTRRVADMMALLVFYHYTGLWQGTNHPRASLKYTARGLKWGRDKVRAVRSLLLKVGLIEDVRRTDRRTGKVVGWFIRLPYFHPTGLPEDGFRQRVDGKATNALRSGTLSVERHSFSSKSRQAGLSEYSEDEREVIDAYHQILCDTDPNWKRVNKYTLQVCAAIQRHMDTGGDLESCVELFTAAANGDANGIPQNKTLVRLLWENY